MRELTTETDEYEPIASVDYRVVRHRLETGDEEFAIHEVYFSADGQVQGYTEDALSPHVSSLTELKAVLQSLLELPGEEVLTGDLNYAYEKVAIEEMLGSTEHPCTLWIP